MAREGIYIGGREIVERYVGDKLVWKKWKYLNSFKTNIGATFYNDKKQGFLPFVPVRSTNYRFNAGDRGKILVKYLNHRGSGSVIVKKVYGYGDAYDSNSTTNLVIEFHTEQDAKEFNNAITNNTTLEIYN